MRDFASINELAVLSNLEPSFDQYHLNEAYYNLGNVFYEIGDMQGAKAA